MPSIRFTPQQQLYHHQDEVHSSLSSYSPESSLKRASIELASEIILDRTKYDEKNAEPAEQNTLNIHRNPSTEDHTNENLVSHNQRSRDISYEEKVAFDDLYDECSAFDDEPDEVTSMKSLTILKALCVAIILVAISIASYFSFNKDSTNVFQPLRTSSDALRQFAPSKHIAQLCDGRFITSYNGFAICSNACQVAKCCFMNEEVKNETCMNEENNNITCASYGPCKPIFNATLINVHNSTSTFSLENICLEENFIEGTNEECVEACLPARCCFSNQNSCKTNETEDWCKMFTPCGKIFDSNIN